MRRTLDKWDHSHPENGQQVTLKAVEGGRWRLQFHDRDGKPRSFLAGPIFTGGSSGSTVTIREVVGEPEE